MFTLVVALALSVVSFCIVKKCKDHKAHIVSVVSIGSVSLCCFGITLVGICLNPQIEIYLGAVLSVGATIVLFKIINEKPISTIIGVIVAVVLMVYLALFSPAIKNVTVENVSYTCTFSKWTGLGETRVNYHKRLALIFVKNEPSFIENYGIYLGGWDNLPNGDPYEVYYND